MAARGHRWRARTAWNMTEPMKPRLTFTQGGDTDTPPPTLLYLITAAAVLLGVWGRFKGLGTWPLNSDEYYIARSVEDILRTGLPGYDCGGYYVRGLAFQYSWHCCKWPECRPNYPHGLSPPSAA